MKNKKRMMTWFELLRTFLAVGIAVGFAVVIIFLVSGQPLEAMYKFFVTPLISFRYLANIIELMTPLLFTGLAVTFILQTKVYNLAVEVLCGRPGGGYGSHFDQDGFRASCCFGVIGGSCGGSCDRVFAGHIEAEI